MVNLKTISRFIFNIYFIILVFNVEFAGAVNEEDEELASSLKSQASHNLNRLKAYKENAANNKVFDDEREKSLAEFLEEQERWDLVRERGLVEYRKLKKQSSPQVGGPEHFEDLREKEKIQTLYEHNRIVHIKTRDRVLNFNHEFLAALEADELNIYFKRPRYELMKRRRNKWAKSGTGFGSTSSGGSSNSGSGFLPNNNDLPPPPEFPSAPAPYDGFDDFPPPPPPVYDGSSGGAFEPGFNGDMPVPPPPPPPPDFDF